jgi:alpha-ketoglutarate-dependent taurine dioxygenase
MTWRERPLTPFGLLVQGPGDITAIPPEALMGMALEHKVAVVRGCAPLTTHGFLAYALRWGPLLEWNFGYVFDLQLQQQPKNYLFASGNVPYHWDGAFAAAVPSFQIFQCLAAPEEDAGGETLFCDTTAVLAGLTPAERRSWSQIQIDYETEKLEHYGGRISAALLAVHPRTGAATVRFAEPFNEGTTPLNLLTVLVQGQNPTRSDAILRAITRRLYAPSVVYAHRWRAGDFVIADNHALLHGRRAFRQHAARHLQRIHVL